MLETLVLSTLNYDSSVASAAARMVSVALGRPDRRDGLAPHERAARPSPPRAPPTSPASTRRRTSRPDARGASRRWAPRRTRSPCCTTRRRPRSERRSRRSGPRPRSSSTPTTSRTGVETAVRVAGTRARRGAHRLGRPAHRGHVGARPARRPRRRRHEDHGHERPRRVHDRRALGRPVDSYGVGTAVVTGSGLPGRRDGLQARRPP